jgi:hypothetical protein
LAGTERAELLPSYGKRDPLTCRRPDQIGKRARGSEIKRADQGVVCDPAERELDL